LWDKDREIIDIWLIRVQAKPLRMTVRAQLPLLIQGILLRLIIYNHQYAKIAIKLWAIIFLCIASGLQFFGRLLQDFVEGFVNNDSTYYLRSGATLLIGILIVVAINRSVRIVEIENEIPDEE